MYFESRGRRVPQGDKRQRDKPTPGIAGAPLVDHPVVVGLNAQQGQFLVLPLKKRLPAEPGQHVRETERGVNVVSRHVGQPVGLLPPAGPDLVEGHRLHVESLEARGCRELGERIDEVVVEPPVALGTAGHALLVGELAALEVEHRAVSLDPRATVVVLRRQA